MFLCYALVLVRERARRDERRGGGKGGDGRKNDGHKYRSYLCFMTVRPRYRQEESARIRGKAPTIDSQILTDVLAQRIPVSPASLSLSLSLSFSPFLSSLVEGGRLVLNRRRMVNVAALNASANLPNLRYLFYDWKRKMHDSSIYIWHYTGRL